MKELKNSIKTNLEHLSDREKWMLIIMFVAVFMMLIYLVYYFMFFKKIKIAKATLAKYEEAMLDLKIEGETYLINRKSKNKNKFKPAEKEVHLYSLIGSLAKKNSIEIKTINEKPVTQKHKGIVQKDVEVYIQAVSLDVLAPFMVSIERSNKAPMYIKTLKMNRDYNDDTKVSARFIVTTFYKKAEDKEKK